MMMATLDLSKANEYVTGKTLKDLVVNRMKRYKDCLFSAISLEAFERYRKGKDLRIFAFTFEQLVGSFESGSASFVHYLHGAAGHDGQCIIVVLKANALEPDAMKQYAYRFILPFDASCKQIFLTTLAH